MSAADLPAARPVVERGRPIPAVPEFAHISEDGSIVFPAGNCVRWLRANIDTLRVQDAADVRRAVAEEVTAKIKDTFYRTAPATTEFQEGADYVKDTVLLMLDNIAREAGERDG